MGEYNQRLLKKFIPLAEGLQRYLGEMYEIVLHDVSEPDHSVVFVAGSLTGRPLGAPLTNVVFQEMKRNGDAAKDMIGYISEYKDGRKFKSSTIFLRDDAGSVIGCFCINLDTSLLQSAADILSRTLGAFNVAQENNREIFASDVNEMVDLIVQHEISEREANPESMTRSERIDFLAELEKKGIFDVKGSVERVAQLLGLSVFTVYSYLKEIRTEKQPFEMPQA